MTATKSIQHLKSELADAMADVCIGTDEGTHQKPAVHTVYETIDGARYAVRVFANGATSRISEADAEARTEGRIRHITHLPLAARQANVSRLEKLISGK